MIILVLACFFSSRSIAQVIFEPIQVNNYFTTYNLNEIIKNKVSSFTLYYCNTSLNRVTHDTFKVYKDEREAKNIVNKIWQPEDTKH